MSASAREVIADVLAGGSREIGPHETGWSDHILTALSAAGFVVVPMEPTEEMRHAGYRVYCANKDGYAAWRHHLDVYRAMLSAAEGKK